MRTALKYVVAVLGSLLLTRSADAQVAVDREVAGILLDLLTQREQQVPNCRFVVRADVTQPESAADCMVAEQEFFRSVVRGIPELLQESGLPPSEDRDAIVRGLTSKSHSFGVSIDWPDFEVSSGEGAVNPFEDFKVRHSFVDGHYEVYLPDSIVGPHGMPAEAEREMFGP